MKNFKIKTSFVIFFEAILENSMREKDTKSDLLRVRTIICFK